MRVTSTTVFMSAAVIMFFMLWVGAPWWAYLILWLVAFWRMAAKEV
jgi:hypothetical protein